MGPSKFPFIEQCRRFVPLAVWAIVILVILAIPVKIISEGFMPTTDALRDAAKAVSGKPWSEILVLGPTHNDTGGEFGWQLFLRSIFLSSQCSATTLVTFSVICLFVLPSCSAIAWLKRPEAWLVALTVASIFSDLAMRLLFGRPLLLTIAGLVTILLMWQTWGPAPPKKPMVVCMGAIIALCIFLHGVWYLWALPVLAFFLAGQIRWGLALVVAWAGGLVVGCLLTGHPVEACSHMTEMGWRAFFLHRTPGTLVIELQPASGEPFALIVVSGLVILRYLSKIDTRKLYADPVFWLACISWVLAFRASRFIEDWFWPAVMVWIACDLQRFLESRLPTDSFKRLALAIGIALTSFLAFTSDAGGRWSQNLTRTYLDAQNPELAGWLPDKGGIFYASDMTLFFQTFFKNPHADWRYILGFEPALMPDEDFQIYQPILSNPNDPEAYQPWVRKMKPADRLVLRVVSGPAPPIPQLEWGYGVNGIWIGRLPGFEHAQFGGPEKAAIDATQSWLAMIDVGDYSGSWKESAAVMRSGASEQDSVAALERNRKPLGRMLSRKLRSAKLSKDLPDAPTGTYVVMEFDTAFENKKSAIETVTFRLESDGTWKAAGYFIH